MMTALQFSTLFDGGQMASVKCIKHLEHVLEVDRAARSRHLHLLDPIFYCPLHLSVRHVHWHVKDLLQSESVAVGIYKRHIAVARGGTTDRWLKEFVQASVSAYTCGCSEEGLRKELLQTRDLDLSVEGIEDCVLNAALVWVTLESTPEKMCRRWATTPAVSSEVYLLWRGFCTLIINAYYLHGMAWFPVQRLQLEQLAVAGQVEHPSVVSSRMRLVFTTLEVVDPRWGTTLL